MFWNSCFRIGLAVLSLFDPRGCCSCLSVLFRSVVQNPIATVMFCFCLDPVVGSGLSLFGAKGPFMIVVICHRGLGYLNFSVLTVVYLLFHTLTNTHT
jgi:hypothetical protein